MFLDRGNLRIATGDHVLTHRPPVAFQTINGRRAAVESRYELADNGDVRFSVGDYDRAAPLVIDPTITYSTYFGGTGPDTISDVATDDIGNVYVVGGSESSDLPIAGSGWKTERHAYIAKLRPDGTPEWLAYLAGSGGNGSDHAVAVDVGPGGDAYVTGVGCGDGFPTTPGAYRTTGVRHTCDAFVARLAPDSTLKYSTLLGAPSAWGPVGAAAIAVDPQGRAAIGGSTASPDFAPTMTNTFGPQRPGYDQPDGFVARFSADGSRLDWSRLLAGSGYDHVKAMALDVWGNLWVAGSTTSGDFPIRTTIKPQKHGPTDPYGEVGYDGFLTEIWEDGQQGMSTFLGGSGEDFMTAIAIGLYDRVYVGGHTNSPEAATFNHDPGKDNGIIYHIGSRSLLKSVPIGGTGYTAVTALAVGPDSMLWMAGRTDGAGFFLNAPDDPLPQRSAAGGHDMFVRMYEPDLSSLWYSYVIGGTDNEHVNGLAVDRLGDVYLVGGTASTDYPVKMPLQASKKDALWGTHDGVITKLGCYVKAGLPVDTQPASGGEGFASVYAAPGCVMEAVSDSAWLRVTGVSDRRITFVTDPNPTSVERQASLTLSGKKVAPVIQAASSGGGVPPTDEIVLGARDIDGAFGDWSVVPDDVHGAILAQPDRGAPKIETASTHPSHWFSFTFTAEAGKPYHLWIHGRAQGDSWRNDSIYAQFSDSVDAAGNPIYRIGTTSATWVSLEECSGCGEQGWGWQDNQYGARGDLGPDIYFATSGTHTIKFQTREDGFDIGQVVLSAKAYLRTAPGGNMNDPTIVTSGTTPPPEPQPIDEIVLWAASDAHVINGPWRVIGDPTAAGQTAVWNPDAGTPKLTSPYATPAGVVDINFNADAGKPYHLWLRMKADNDHWTNDSVWVQFSGSVDASGNPVYRIGSASGTWVSLEECSGCGEQGWGWQDNAYGSPGNLGPPIYFAASGPQTIRIQNREDGVTIDQIVLSAGRYATSAPGSNKNDTTILPRTPK